MLEVRRLYTGYGGMDVIHGIDITVGAGEIVALVGANGAGKSTLVKTISGLLQVRSGEILFEGKRIDRLSPTARVLLGIAQVPEGRQVFGGLTVAENLRLGAYVYRRALAEAELQARMREVCERFPILLERLDEPVANLSGGQQQMLVIARGLMAKPRLLILDEPSLGLAPVLVADIFRLIAALRAQGGVSIVLSEQNAKLSLAIADRAYVIETGRVALAGTGQELLASAEVAERYLGVGHAVSVADAPRHAQLVGRLKEIFGKGPEPLTPPFRR
jgi:branched-chain amino acid transport system ATP-binding protein